MRILPSVASASWVQAGLSITVTARDGSRSFTFGAQDLAGLTGLSFEVPFMGGLVKPSTYDVTLSTSLGWLKEMLPQLPRAQVNLQVSVNSDTFCPHVGRVRGVTRSGADPNQVTLRVYDQLLDYNPQVPLEAIVDSWSTPHAQDLDLGYPLYYGRHLRPLYHTAVTCDLSVLLGARNVSSANHAAGVWFCSDLSKGSDVVQGEHNLLMNKSWQQQSGAGNLVSGGFPFEVTDAGALDTRFWSFDGGLRQSDTVSNVSTPAVLRVCNFGYVDLVAFKETAAAGQHYFYGAVLLRKQIQQAIQRTTHVRLCTTISNIASGGTTQARFYVDSAGAPLVLALEVPGILQPSNVASGDLDVSSDNSGLLFSNGQAAYYECFHSGSETGL
ncbi:MAG TPA: hypothetical protein VL359_07495, partial [bacterium]|nr:hypothetical protein [bacterium]